MLFFQKMAPKSPPIFITFSVTYRIDVLMLCRKFELIPTKIFQVMTFFKNRPISEKYPVL